MPRQFANYPSPKPKVSFRDPAREEADRYYQLQQEQSFYPGGDSLYQADSFPEQTSFRGDAPLFVPQSRLQQANPMFMSDLDTSNLSLMGMGDASLAFSSQNAYLNNFREDLQPNMSFAFNQDNQFAYDFDQRSQIQYPSRDFDNYGNSKTMSAHFREKSRERVQPTHDYGSQKLSLLEEIFTKGWISKAQSVELYKQICLQRKPLKETLTLIIKDQDLISFLVKEGLSRVRGILEKCLPQLHQARKAFHALPNGQMWKFKNALEKVGFKEACERNLSAKLAPVFVQNGRPFTLAVIRECLNTEVKLFVKIPAAAAAEGSAGKRKAEQAAGGPDDKTDITPKKLKLTPSKAVASTPTNEEVLAQIEAEDEEQEVEAILHQVEENDDNAVKKQEQHLDADAVFGATASGPSEVEEKDGEEGVKKEDEDKEKDKEGDSSTDVGAAAAGDVEGGGEPSDATAGETDGGDSTQAVAAAGLVSAEEMLSAAVKAGSKDVEELEVMAATMAHLETGALNLKMALEGLKEKEGEVMDEDGKKEASAAVSQTPLADLLRASLTSIRAALNVHQTRVGYMHLRTSMQHDRAAERVLAYVRKNIIPSSTATATFQEEDSEDGRVTVKALATRYQDALRRVAERKAAESQAQREQLLEQQRQKKQQQQQQQKQFHLPDQEEFEAALKATAGPGAGGGGEAVGTDGTNTNASGLGAVASPSKYCIHYNKGKCTRGKKCSYVHACTHCGGTGHPAITHDDYTGPGSGEVGGNEWNANPANPANLGVKGASNASGGKGNGSGTIGQAKICVFFNRIAGCTNVECRFAHKCKKCGEYGHGFHACWKL